jgi:hypothetical protein
MQSPEWRVQSDFYSAPFTLESALPMWLSSDSSSFVNCRALPHESASLSVGPSFSEESTVCSNKVQREESEPCKMCLIAMLSSVH